MENRVRICKIVSIDSNDEGTRIHLSYDGQPYGSVSISDRGDLHSEFRCIALSHLAELDVHVSITVHKNPVITDIHVGQKILTVKEPFENSRTYWTTDMETKLIAPSLNASRNLGRDTSLH